MNNGKVLLKSVAAVFWAISAAAKSSVVPLASATLLFAAIASAQQVPNTPPSRQKPQPPPSSAQGTASDVAPVKEEHERVLFVVPAFEVTNRQDAPALTAKQKFALAARGTFDPFVWVSTGILAGMSQASNEFPQYGRGAAGYGKRYGAAMLDSVDGAFASVTLRVLLKQDPRYFRLGRGSVRRRFFYALSHEVSTKSDKRRRQFNWSRVLGMLASGAVANAYYPPRSRGFGLTMNRFAVSLLWDPTGELTDEFWPGIDRKFFHRKQRDHGGAAGSP
jgi:hypothetical protein